MENDAEWQSDARDIVAQVACSGEDRPIAGLIGIVVDEGADRSRPCLTMLVSGPGGALEAAFIIRHALAECGLNAAVAIRTVRHGTAGVVKVPFLPEAYVGRSGCGFGIDWKLWSRLAPADPVYHWATASLIWCDCVISATQRVREKASLMIDDVYFDFLRTVPFMSQDDATFSLFGGPFAHLMQKEPHEFLFGSSVV